MRTKEGGKGRNIKRQRGRGITNKGCETHGGGGLIGGKRCQGPTLYAPAYVPLEGEVSEEAKG